MNALDQYRQAKATYLKLHGQAKKDLIVRANELVGEIAQIQRELREDFGYKWTCPKNGKTPRKKIVKADAVDPKPTVDPKLVRTLERKLAAAVKKQESATDPKATKALADRVYEIKDELRLAQGD